VKVESYTVNKKPIQNLCKQSAVWGCEGNTSWPLFYMQRPKWIKDDKAWAQIVDSVRLALPCNFEVN